MENKTEIIDDESKENYQDSDSDADKDETLPELREEKASDQPIRKISSMQKPKVQVHIKTAREEYEERIFKYDTLRKRWDIRNRNKIIKK